MKSGPSFLPSLIQSTKSSRSSIDNIFSRRSRSKEKINPSHILMPVFGKVTMKSEQITTLWIRFSSLKNGKRDKMRLWMIWLKKMWLDLKDLTKNGLFVSHKCSTLTLSFYTTNLSSFTPWFLPKSTICTNNLRNKTDVSNLLNLTQNRLKSSFSKRKFLNLAKSLSGYLAVSKIATILIIYLQILKPNFMSICLLFTVMPTMSSVVQVSVLLTNFSIWSKKFEILKV